MAAGKAKNVSSAKILRTHLDNLQTYVEPSGSIAYKPENTKIAQNQA